MSWIIGAFDAPNDICNSVRGLVRQTPSLLYTSEGNNHFIAAGGLAETCFASTQYPDFGWMAVGCAFDKGQQGIKHVRTDAWQTSLQSTTLPSDGHFAAIKWEEDQFRAYIDALGLRTLYYKQLETGLLFSTRLDWMNHVVGPLEIDLESFGSHWLAFNAFISNAPVKQVGRLGEGGVLTYQSGVLAVSDSPWSPSKEAASPDDFYDALNDFIQPDILEHTLSLGLSGGLDSRFLLAIPQDPSFLRTHSFGQADHPDARIAAAMTKRLGYLHHLHYDEAIEADIALLTLRDHVAQTQAMTPASASWKLKTYGNLRDLNLASIDGGFGEIARRQFLNRLRLQGARDLLRGDYEALFKYYTTPRAALFRVEIEDAMREGAVRQLVNAWHEMPLPAEIGLENALDLFSVRTRLPNFYGYEQSRLDAMVLNYMPFAQPSVLDILFGISIENRKNGRLFRERIRRQNPRLRRFPLVKGDQTYPYFLPPLSALAWTRMKRWRKDSTDRIRNRFLRELKPVIMDSVHSAAVQQSELYDGQGVFRFVTAYFGGKEELAGFVDWWFSFEIWRQEVLSPKV